MRVTIETSPTKPAHTDTHTHVTIHGAELNRRAICAGGQSPSTDDLFFGLARQRNIVWDGRAIDRKLPAREID